MPNTTASVPQICNHYFFIPIIKDELLTVVRKFKSKMFKDCYDMSIYYILPLYTDVNPCKLW